MRRDCHDNFLRAILECCRLGFSGSMPFRAVAHHVQPSRRFRPQPPDGGWRTLRFYGCGLCLCPFVAWGKHSNLVAFASSSPALWPHAPQHKTRRSAGAAAGAFCFLNQGAQGRIHGFFVGKMCGDVWRKEHQICSCAVASEIFATDSTFQFREVVFPAHAIAAKPFVSFLLHSIFARPELFCGR